MPLISLNTRRGDVGGENGLAALPGRQAEARAAIDEAVDWAVALNAGAVHVMAGAVENNARPRGKFLWIISTMPAAWPPPTVR